MSIYPCPECGKNISTYAVECPYCGTGFITADQKFLHKVGWGLAFAICVFLVVFLFSTLLGPDRPGDAERAKKNAEFQKQRDRAFGIKR
jgi:hypothetical protein